MACISVSGTELGSAAADSFFFPRSILDVVEPVRSVCLS